MLQTETIERANPHAKRFLLGSLVAITLIGIVYYTRLLLTIQVPFAYLIPVLLASGTFVMIVLYRQGNSNLPLIPLLVGVVSIVGGASFDVIATLAKSPTLTMETNPVARSLLDSGHSVEFVYMYGLSAQVLIIILGSIMWVAFLRHRQTLLASARDAKPQSYLEFVKAALGGEHLSWRQYLLPLKLSDLPKSYHMMWLCAVIWVGVSPFRWYLGLEWLNWVHGFRGQVIAILMVLSLIGYAVWLWIEYSNKSGKSAQ